MDVDQIRKAGDDLHIRYAWNFAGFPRGTRDPAELEQLAQAMSSLISQATETGDDALVEDLRSKRKLYQNEKRQVIAVHESHPNIVEASFLFLDVRARQHQYIRGYAGQERASRDQDALKEASAELHSLATSLVTLLDGADVEIMRGYADEATRLAELFEQEVTEIAESRDGLTAQENLAASARSANELFTKYKQNFAGLPRVSRRPRLLKRLVESLSDVKAWMEGIGDVGDSSATLAKNIETVNSQLATWQAEQAAVLEARQGCSFDELIQALEVEFDDVNAVYAEEFAGKDRAGRDLERLSGLCSRLDNLERVCRRQLEVRDEQRLQNLLDAVRQSRFRLCREWDEIKKAKDKPLDGSLN